MLSPFANFCHNAKRVVVNVLEKLNLLFSLTQQDLLATAQPLLLNYLDEPFFVAIPQGSRAAISLFPETQ